MALSHFRAGSAQQLLMKAFALWACYRSASQARRAAFEAVVQRSLWHRRLAALGSWKRCFIASLHRGDEAKALARAVTCRSLRGVFASWRSLAECSHARYIAGRAAAQSTAQRRQLRALGLWSRLSATARHSREVEEAVGRSACRRCLIAAMGAWCRLYVSAHLLRLASLSVERRRCLRALRLWGHLATCFHRLRDKVRETTFRRQQTAMRSWRCLLVWGRLYRHQARRWLDYCRRLVATRRFLEASVTTASLHAAQRCMRKVLGMWGHFLVMRRACRDMDRAAAAWCATRRCKDALARLTRLFTSRHRLAIGMDLRAKARRAEALRWLAASALRAVHRRRSAVQRRASLLHRGLLALRRYVCVLRAGSHVVARLTSGHLGRWAVASGACRMLRTAGAPAQAAARRWAFLWYVDCPHALVSFIAWGRFAREARQLHIVERLGTAIQRNGTLHVLLAWMRLLRQQRAERYVRSATIHSRMCFSMNSWHRCSMANRLWRLRTVALERSCLTQWRGITRKAFADRAISLAAFCAWRAVVEAHKIFVDDLRRFYSCCEQANVIAAKVAGRNGISVLCAWRLSAKRTINVRQRYFLAVKAAHLQPARVAFRAFYMAHTSQRRIRLAEALAQSIHSARLGVLVRAVRCLRHHSAVCELVRGCLASRVRGVWAAWRGCVALDQRIRAGVLRLRAVLLACGVQALRRAVIQAAAVDSLALALSCRYRQSRPFDAWRVYAKSIHMERASAALLRWSQCSRAGFLRRWLGAWWRRCVRSCRTRRMHLRLAMRRWRGTASARLCLRRRSNLALGVAAQHLLRRTVCGWLLAGLHSVPLTCARTEGKWRQRQTTTGGLAAAFAARRAAAAALPAGSGVDRLSLWAAAVQTARGGAQRRHGCSATACGAATCSGAAMKVANSTTAGCGPTRIGGGGPQKENVPPPIMQQEVVAV